MTTTKLLALIFVCLAPAGILAQDRDPRRAGDPYAGPYHVEAKPTRRITFIYTIHAQTPDDKIDKWVVNLPVPPNTGSQQIESVDFALSGVKAAWKSQKDKSPLARPFKTAILGGNGGAEGKLTATVTYKAAMLQRKLVPGKPARPIEELSAAERKLTTMPTVTCNYRDEAVQKWIADHDLKKRPDENDLQFAARVFETVQKSLTYEVPAAAPDFFRCSRSIRTGTADCGASNLLVSGVLRNAGIPARVYCGRWIVHPKPGDSHSRGEFFAAGVGWVPVDATASFKAGLVQRHNFGADPALYLATSTETDWKIDLPPYGIQNLTWLHQYVVPYRKNGKSAWDGFRLEEEFRLTETR